MAGTSLRARGRGTARAARPDGTPWASSTSKTSRTEPAAGRSRSRAWRAMSTALALFVARPDQWLEQALCSLMITNGAIAAPSLCYLTLCRGGATSLRRGRGQGGPFTRCQQRSRHRHNPEIRGIRRERHRGPSPPPTDRRSGRRLDAEVAPRLKATLASRNSVDADPALVGSSSMLMPPNSRSPRRAAL